MLSEIINILSKEDNDLSRIIILILKILFTFLISSYLYINFYGNYRIISITDLLKLSNFITSGRIIICLTIFYLVWLVSFNFFSVFLNIIVFFITSKFTNFLYKLGNIEKSEIKKEILNLKKSKTHFYLIRLLLNSVELIEIDKEEISLGNNFYNFYEFLQDIEDKKIHISSTEQSSIIFLLLQFIIIYNFYTVNFLSLNILLWIVCISSFSIYFFWNLFLYSIVEILKFKHYSILNILDKIDDDDFKVN